MRSISMPTKQTSFEFIPIAYFFSDNDDTPADDTLGQGALFQLEAHLTHDLSQMFWGSLNVLYAFGGETSINGEDQDDDLEYFGGGATLGARLPKSWGTNITFGTDLWTKTDDTDGHWIRVSFTKTF